MENTRFNVGDIVYSIIPVNQFKIYKGVIVDSNIPYEVRYDDPHDNSQMTFFEHPDNVYPTLEEAKEEQRRIIEEEIGIQTKFAEQCQQVIDEYEKLYKIGMDGLNSDEQKFGFVSGLFLSTTVLRCKESLEHTLNYIETLKQNLEEF